MVQIISVFGLYSRRAAVEEAVAELRGAGFRNTDISALLPDRQQPQSDNPQPDTLESGNAGTPASTVTGAASGVAVGGVLGWLAGIGALSVPGVDTLGYTLAGAGPIMGMLAGAAAAGVMGGFVGALAGMGIPESTAKHYDKRIQAGGILLSIHCDDAAWVKRARAVLKRTGASRISSSAQALSRFAKSDEGVPHFRE